MTTTCACGAPAGTGPEIVDSSGSLCDRCVARIKGEAFLAKVDQARAHASASVDKAPDDAAQAWLRSGLMVYCSLGLHDLLVPMTLADRFRFFAWVQQVDPDGWVRHRDELLSDA